MSNRIVAVSILVIVFSGFSQASLSDDAMHWIQKMSDSMRNLSYRGIFVYIHENQLESMSISHVKNRHGEHERLLSLNGEAREVYRDNQNLTCIWPSSRKVVVDSSKKNSFSPIFIPEDIDRISKFYEIKVAGEDRIADQTARVIHVDPKDEFRYGFKFWISEQNGLMLKSALLDERGEYIEQIMFTEMSEISDEEKTEKPDIPTLEDGFSLIQFHSGDSASSQNDDMSWTSSNMPEGFWRESSVKRKIPGTDGYMHQVVYTDGLASISIFIEKENDQMQQQNASMGAVNAYIHMYQGYSITAIGEVPAATVKIMAESISRSQ